MAPIVRPEGVDRRGGEERYRIKLLQELVVVVAEHRHVGRVNHVVGVQAGSEPLVRLIHLLELVEATDLCAKVLRLERQVFGNRHPEIVETLRVLARLEEERSRWAEAVEAPTAC